MILSLLKILSKYYPYNIFDGLIITFINQTSLKIIIIFFKLLRIKNLKWISKINILFFKND